MNTYTYEELTVGKKESFTVVVTEAALDAFRLITGDVNPMHQDDAFAKKRGMTGHIAFGMLVAGYYSTLAGVYLPGENCLLHKVDSQFSKPVYPGDTLTVTGEIAEREDTFSMVIIKAEIHNQHGQKVSRARIQAGVLHE